MTHQCQYPGCRERISRSPFCRAHWELLPQSIKRTVMAAMRLPATLPAAVKAAREWVKSNALVVPPTRPFSEPEERE